MVVLGALLHYANPRGKFKHKIRHHWRNQSLHGVQRRMISVDNFFRIFEIIIFSFVVAICDLVHAVEAMYSLP